MEKKILARFIEVLIEEGVPLEIFKRDMEIRDKFYSAISDNPKINKTALKTRLADEYNIGYKSVENIIYAKNEAGKE